MTLGKTIDSLSFLLYEDLQRNFINELGNVKTKNNKLDYVLLLSNELKEGSKVIERSTYLIDFLLKDSIFVKLGEQEEVFLFMKDRLSSFFRAITNPEEVFKASNYPSLSNLHFKHFQSLKIEGSIEYKYFKKVDKDQVTGVQALVTFRRESIKKYNCCFDLEQAKNLVYENTISEEVINKYIQEK